MEILEYYTERQKDKNWVEKYQSTSSKNHGKTFKFKNTNFRKLTTFIQSFDKFKRNNQLNREEWEKHITHGQEIDKQYVVNMRRSKLFSIKNQSHVLTKKGESFENFSIKNLSENDKWIITYLYLLNSYFELIPNYILKEVELLNESLNDFGIQIDNIQDDILKLLNMKKVKKEDLFDSDIFWLITFNNDIHFINLFVEATEIEKFNLKKHVLDKLREKSESDLLVYKFKASGQYTVNMFLDDLKIIYMTNIIFKNLKNPFEIFYNNILEEYSKIYNTNSHEIYRYINAEKDVFDIILREASGQEIYEVSGLNYVFSDFNQTVHESNQNLDSTSLKDVNRIRIVNNALKKIALDLSNYHCILEPLFGCNYFTSKESGKNYLEIHHLIPREFSNEFEESIEVVSNYVPLCPHCHKLIHHASDRERVTAIRFLFNLRSEELHNSGLKTDFDILSDFYKLNQKNSHQNA